MKTINPIIEEINANRNHYCHALEVNDVFELESIFCDIFQNYINKYSIEIIVDFCETLSIYCLDDDNEEEVYSFNISEFIQNL